MTILKHIKRLKYIDFMIKRKATGDLERFAHKNNLSKTTLSEIINDMKELGFPIKYDRQRRTYYYDEEGQMVHALFIRNGQILSREEAAKIDSTDNLCFSEIEVFKLCENP
jgi:predicted transcriptional regulator